MSEKIARREFVKRSMTAAGAGVVLSRGNVHARVLGSNDRINLGVIGVCGRGTDVMKWAMETGKKWTKAQVVAVSDV